MYINTFFLYIESEVEVKLLDRDRDMSRLDTQHRIGALASFHQPLSICAFQRDSFKKDNHHQVQPPHLRKDMV